MSFSSAISSSMPPIPYGGISGFDAIPSGVMGYIGEYVGCLAEGDQPSLSVYQNYECFRILFAPRLERNRLVHIVQLDDELNKEYASYQNYKRIVDCWNVSKLLLRNHWNLFENVLGEHLHRIAGDQAFYSSPTLRQFLLKEPVPSPRDILAVCDVLDQENNGEARVVFPTQRLRAMVQSMQGNVDANVAARRNVKTRSVFKKILAYSVAVCKKVLACAVAICLIARHIFSEIAPLMFWKAVLQGVAQGGLLIGVRLALSYGPRQVLPQMACMISQIALRYIVMGIAGWIVVFHAAFHIGVMRGAGSAQGAWEFEKIRFGVIAQHVGHIWRSRELITDLYIKGAAAHASIATESIRQLGPIQGLRHGFRVLSRIAREGLAQAQ